MDPKTEMAIRIACYAAAFAALGLWEMLAPRRPRFIERTRRWPGNLGILAIDALAVRVLVPTAAVGAAVLAAERGWGLFNLAGMPLPLAAILGFLILDLAIYVQHFVFHHVPVLWRLHRMHHADLDIDVTTGARFHPIEILISLGVKFVAIVALGAPPLAVLLFEIGLNASSMFNHGNVRIPLAIERIVRLLVVTPDMHRVHH